MAAFTILEITLALICFFFVSCFVDKFLFRKTSM